jgi:hypothetical protein
MGVFEQLLHRGFRVGVGAGGSRFHQTVILSFFSGLRQEIERFDRYVLKADANANSAMGQEAT